MVYKARDAYIGIVNQAVDLADRTMLDAAGDKDGFEKASVTLKQWETALKQFAAETKRTYKPDHVQVQGFGHGQAGKVMKLVENSPLKLYNDIKANGDLAFGNAKMAVGILAFITLL